MLRRRQGRVSCEEERWVGIVQATRPKDTELTLKGIQRSHFARVGRTRDHVGHVITAAELQISGVNRKKPRNELYV